MSATMKRELRKNIKLFRKLQNPLFSDLMTGLTFLTGTVNGNCQTVHRVTDGSTTHHTRREAHYQRRCKQGFYLIQINEPKCDLLYS